jgi:hypothetical protein
MEYLVIGGPMSVRDAMAWRREPRSYAPMSRFGKVRVSL